MKFLFLNDERKGSVFLRHLIFIFIFSFILISFWIFSLDIVIAQNGDSEGESRVGVPEIGPTIERLFESVVDSIKKIDFGFLDNYMNYFLDLVENNSYNVMRVFFGFLLFIILYGVVDTLDFFDSYSNKFNLLLSVSITVISMIAMPRPFLDFLVPAYESMASTLFSIIPFFLIIFFSIKIKKQFIGRMVWLFVTVLFILLFLAKGLPELLEGDWVNGMIYLVMALAGLLMVIFLPAIRKWFFKGELKEMEESMKEGVKIEAALKKANLEQVKADKEMLRGK
jgi:hypothetical protein